MQFSLKTLLLMPLSQQFAPSKVLEDGIYSYWAPQEGQTCWEMLFDLGQSTSFNMLQLQEPIQLGQRVIEFHVAILIDELWQTIVEGTTLVQEAATVSSR